MRLIGFIIKHIYIYGEIFTYIPYIQIYIIIKNRVPYIYIHIKYIIQNVLDPVCISAPGSQTVETEHSPRARSPVSAIEIGFALVIGMAGGGVTACGGIELGLGLGLWG